MKTLYTNINCPHCNEQNKYYVIIDIKHGMPEFINLIEKERKNNLNICDINKNYCIYCNKEYEIYSGIEQIQ